MIVLVTNLVTLPIFVDTVVSKIVDVWYMTDVKVVVTVILSTKKALICSSAENRSNYVRDRNTYGSPTQSFRVHRVPFTQKLPQ